MLIAKELGMSSVDVNGLYHAFCTYEKVQKLKKGTAKTSGWIDMYTFFLFHEIAGESLARHLVDSCFRPSPESDDLIDFEQFAIVVWHLVTILEKKMAAFFFTTFDRDHDGWLIKGEAEAMIDALSGTDVHLRERLDASLTPIGAHHEGINRKAFVEVVDKNSALLQPLFQMQLLLRERTVKARFLKLQHVKADKFTLDKSLPEIIEALPTVLKPAYCTSGHSTASSAKKPVKTTASDARKGSVVPTDDSKARKGSVVPTTEEAKTPKCGHMDDSSRHGSSKPATRGGHTDDSSRHGSSKPATRGGHLDDGSRHGASTPNVPSGATTPKNNYVAGHARGNEFHAATEHHEYLLHPSGGSGGSSSSSAHPAGSVKRDHVRSPRRDGTAESVKKDAVTAPRTPRGGDPATAPRTPRTPHGDAARTPRTPRGGGDDGGGGGVPGTPRGVK
jgi:hypothetical protein